MMTDLTPLLFEADHLIAIVGATDIAYKYGSIIYRDLKGKGFNVVAVNTTRLTVDGDEAYPNLASLPRRPTLINFVIPPEESMGVIAEAHDLGLGNVWLQPGSDSPQTIAALEAAGTAYLADSCIMVRARRIV